MTADPNRLKGQKIDQYEIIRHIASGGMAEVYLAKDADLQRPVALKIMLPALAADADAVARFRREAQAAAGLDHPNVIHIYAIGTTETQRPYIAMQYVEGGALQDTLDRLQARGELLDVRQALSIVGKMAGALQAAHDVGIVHRDVKPSNILIRPDGAPVLADLGIAAVRGSARLTHTGTLMGTPHYMSPEQTQGQELDGRSDIYSLGVILYELLAGKRPFEADEPMAVMHQQMHQPPAPLEQFRPDLQPATIALVETCLRKDASQRYQSAEALRRAVNEALRAEGGPGIITNAGLWEPQPSSAYRLSSSKIVRSEDEAKNGRPWLWAAILALLLVLPFAAFQLAPSWFGFSGGAAPTAVPVALRDTPAPEIIVVTATSGPATATFAPLPTFTPTPTPTPTPTETPTATPEVGPVTLEIGRSVLGEPITAVSFGDGPNEVMLVGGLHAGYAPGSVTLAERAIDYFTDNPQQIPQEVTLTIIPNASPDSPAAAGRAAGRLNANGVDLNRNWGCRWKEDATFSGSVVPDSGGPQPFSEPETRALRDFFVERQPEVVIFYEAAAANGWSAPGLCTDEEPISDRPARIYGVAAGYKVTSYEDETNDELNGDVTNWLNEQSIPAIAILLPDYDAVDWLRNLDGIMAVLEAYD